MLLRFVFPFPRAFCDAALGFAGSTLRRRRLTRRGRLPSTSYAALRDQLRPRSAAHHRASSRASCGVRVFWIEACVGCDTRGAPSVARGRPRASYRSDPGRPEQSAALSAQYALAAREAPHDLPIESPNSRKDVYCNRRRRLPHSPVAGRIEHTRSTHHWGTPAAAATQMPEESKEVDILPRLRGILMSSDFSNQFSSPRTTLSRARRGWTTGSRRRSNMSSTTTSCTISTGCTSKRSRRRSKNTIEAATLDQFMSDARADAGIRREFDSSRFFLEALLATTTYETFLGLMMTEARPRDKRDSKLGHDRRGREKISSPTARPRSSATMCGAQVYETSPLLSVSTSFCPRLKDNRQLGKSMTLVHSPDCQSSQGDTRSALGSRLVWTNPLCDDCC